GHGALHPRRQPGARHHRGADRARHGRRHGHLRPRGRARPRPQDRRRCAVGRAEQSGGHCRLSRHQQGGQGMKSVKLVEQTATDTLPKLLRRNAQQFGRQIGMREKDRGIWQSYTWRQCYGHVRAFALGLAAAGFKRGDKLSVLGDNRARLYWAQLAAQALGGMSVPLYQDSIAKELAFVLGHAEVSVVVAEDQEQVDKVLSIAGELPSLRLVVYDDPRGMGGYEHPLLKSFGE